MAGKYIADAMLGSLTKKLRMLGIDTVYLKDAKDSEIKYVVRLQGRTLLSRDTRLVRDLGRKAVLVTGLNTREEFLSIAPVLAAACRPTSPMSLCLKCNGPLVPMEPDAARDKVPPYVLEKGTDIVWCSACAKAYWRGSHAGRMEKEIAWMEGEMEKTVES
jgi:uncharacterized protein with PIN domain